MSDSTDRLQSSSLKLEFKCPSGTFAIASSTEDEGMFVLSLIKNASGNHCLGTYQSINDAILAVLKQETGYAEWDQKPPHEIPRKVHDIASWQFSESPADSGSAN